MSDLNSVHNRAVWFDVPVKNLSRSAEFYQAVLACEVSVHEMEGMKFGVFEHKDGNGGCLIEAPEQITSTGGLLLYFNVNERIRDAVSKVEPAGGKILETTHQIGPHGFRAICLDSEGNRIALHSNTDA
ncbi:MAG: VOC family protein [Planctomycetes bacterium]|nr:VOC family protein [Planctomycetota bacterium]